MKLFLCWELVGKTLSKGHQFSDGVMSLLPSSCCVVIRTSSSEQNRRVS